MVNIRVFLAGSMVVYHPTQVFESMGCLDHALLEAAKPLLSTFEKILGAIKEKKGAGGATGSFQDEPAELTKDFTTLFVKYLQAFKAWKVPDEAKLTNRIKHALLALYQAGDSLAPDEPEDSRVRLEFNEQISKLRSKLRQIAGQEALAKFDEDRRNGGALFQLVAVETEKEDMAWASTFLCSGA